MELKSSQRWALSSSRSPSGAVRAVMREKAPLISTIKNDPDNRIELGFGMNSDTFEKQMVFQTTTTMNKQNNNKTPNTLKKLLYQNGLKQWFSPGG